MDNFISVLSRVMSRQEARELTESTRERQSEEYDRYRQREDNYRRSREIGYDVDFDIFRYGAGGLKI